MFVYTLIKQEIKPLTFSCACLFLLCGSAILVASERHYIIQHSLAQSCADRHSNATFCEDNDLRLILSQFISNPSKYLSNDTTLIFPSGYYSLESEFIIKDVQSFSMFAWPGSSSKAVIMCAGHNARFEFRNVSTVTLNGLEFNTLNNNEYQTFPAVIYVTHTNLTIRHSTFTGFQNYTLIQVDHGKLTIAHSKFINNTCESILTAWTTDISISHSEFSFSKGGLHTHDKTIASIDHCKFINTDSPSILYASNVSTINVTHSQFVDNTMTNSILYLDGAITLAVSVSDFINNNGSTLI